MKDASQIQEAQFEPCFQRKKRLEGPTATLWSDFSNLENNSEEYILLGKNDKFQDNIKYKCRSLKNFDKAQAKNKENNLPSKSLQDQSNKLADEYVLLGNNSKFVRNIIYKLKSCPEVEIINDKNKENPASDEEDNARKSKSQEELSNLDDYILLGNNAKFSDNVVYRPKIWREFTPSYDTENENKPSEDTECFPVQAKNLEPAPFIDTSKFREPPEKLKKLVEKTDDSEVKKKEEKREARDGQNVSAEKSVKFLSPPPAPRSPLPTGINEDHDKKLLALLHKSGIHIPPEPGANQSEYQKNFTWKKPFPNSFTAAENKKIFQSISVLHADMAHQDPVPKLSEYQRNFQAWVPLATNLTSPTVTAEKREARKQTMKPSKPKKPHIANAEANSLSLVTNTDKGNESNEDQPDVGTTASGICFDDDDNDDMQDNDTKSMKCEESVNSSPVKKKPSKHQERECNNSEYMENFKAPSKFDYMNNAWNAQKSVNEDMQEVLRDDMSKSDWYSEVLDLRRKAFEYRQRAQNTHFCSDHMAQLVADETQLWENTASNKPAAVGMDARHMRPAGITYNTYYLRKPLDTAETQKLSSNSAPETQMTLEDVTDDADAESTNSELEEADANHIHAMSETGTVPVASAEEKGNNGGATSPQIDEDASKPSEGRVPTPDLEEQNIKRHHLDRTTPIKGNLLITPPKTYKKAEAEYYPYNRNELANTLESRNNSASEPEMKPKHCVKSCALPSQNNCLPTFGKPSKDTHILRAQENISNSSISPPKTSFVQQSPTLSRDTSNTAVRPGNKRPKKSLFSKQHPTGMKMHQSAPETITKPKISVPAERRSYAARHKPNDKTHLEEGLLSQSLESNHSLASEIFERTRKRLNFW